MKRLFCHLLALAVVATLGACGEEGGSLGESGAGKSSHNAGRDCAGCHGARYAGTVYQSASGSVVSNAVIVITENSGTVIQVTADDSGNFYTQNGNPSGGYTATVKGNTIGMVTKPINGACSSGGCHDGATTSVVYIN